MKTTTIQISNETKRKIDSFRKGGESYNAVLQRLYNLAVKEQLRLFNAPSDEFISIYEASRIIRAKYGSPLSKRKRK